MTAAQVYSRLVAGIRAMEDLIKFSESERLGWLTFCPTNLGTAIRCAQIILDMLLLPTLNQLNE